MESLSKNNVLQNPASARSTCNISSFGGFPLIKNSTSNLNTRPQSKKKKGYQTRFSKLDFKNLNSQILKTYGQK